MPPSHPDPLEQAFNAAACTSWAFSAPKLCNHLHCAILFFFFLIIYFYLKNSNLKKSCKYSVNNFFLESFERKFLTKYHIISDTLVGISYKQGHFPT